MTCNYIFIRGAKKGEICGVRPKDPEKTNNRCFEHNRVGKRTVTDKYQLCSDGCGKVCRRVSKTMCVKCEKKNRTVYPLCSNNCGSISRRRDSDGNISPLCYNCDRKNIRCESINHNTVCIRCKESCDRIDEIVCSKCYFLVKYLIKCKNQLKLDSIYRQYELEDLDMVLNNIKD